MSGLTTSGRCPSQVELTHSCLVTKVHRQVSSSKTVLRLVVVVGLNLSIALCHGKSSHAKNLSHQNHLSLALDFWNFDSWKNASYYERELPGLIV